MFLLESRFAPELVGGPWTVNITETQALLEEILRINATDRDTVTPFNEFIFEITTNNEWFGIDEDGKVFVKKVCTLSSHNRCS